MLDDVPVTGDRLAPDAPTPPPPKVYDVRSRGAGDMMRVETVIADRMDYRADGRTIHFTTRSGHLVAIIGTSQLVSITRRRP